MNRQSNTSTATSTTTRKPNSHRKKLDEKIRNHFSVFRVNMSKRSIHDNNGGSMDSIHTIHDLDCQPMDIHTYSHQPNSQQNHHHQHSFGLDSGSCDDLLAWAQELPSTAFVDLNDTSNPDMAFGQMSPIFYHPLNIPSHNNVQQPVVNNATNDHPMDFTNTHNNHSVPHLRSHYSYPSIFSYDHNNNDATFGSLSSSSTCTTNPFDNPNLTTNQTDSSQQNHANCSSMPSRPNPPAFKNGPSYLRASEDFILFFHAIDADDSGLITFDELKQYLRNKDPNNTNFNNEAVMTLIEMFDTSKLLNSNIK